MAQIDVLPRALSAAARAVRGVVHDVHPLPAADLGHADLSAALGSFVRVWSGDALLTAAEERAHSLNAAAQEYAAVESLLLPRALP